MKKTADKILEWYSKQGALLLKHAILLPEFGCRFYPTCSEYTRNAVKKYGLAQGLLKGMWRIARCNPLNKGGIDYP